MSSIKLLPNLGPRVVVEARSSFSNLLASDAIESLKGVNARFDNVTGTDPLVVRPQHVLYRCYRMKYLTEGDN